MSNLSDSKLVSGRTPAIGYSYRKTPISGDLSTLLPPAAYEGSWAYYDNDMYLSDGTTWKTPAPPIIRTPSPITPDPNKLITKRQLVITGYVSTVVGLLQTGAKFQISLTREFTNPVTFIVDATATPAGSFIIGQSYTISSLGTTNWSQVTGKNKTWVEGDRFTAVTIGSGNGIATFNPNSYTILPNEPDIALTPGTVFYWRGKYMAENAQESAWCSITAQTFPYYIEKPKIVTSAGLRTSKLQISRYETAFSLPGEVTYANTIWYLYYSINGSPNNVIRTTDNVIPKLDTVEYLTKGSTYYWKAEHSGFLNNKTVSSPSTDIQQQLEVLDIATPEIVSKIGAVLTELEVTPFDSSAKPPEQLAEVIWEFYTSPDLADYIRNYTLSYNALTMTYASAAKLSVTALTFLEEEVIYYWRVRYKTVSGKYSEYSSLQPVAFIKASLINTPVLSGEITPGTVLDKFLLTGFVSAYSLTFIQTNYEIYSNSTVSAQNLLYSQAVGSDTTGFILAGVSQTLRRGQLYYWRARYSGRIGGVGATPTTSKWTELYAYIQPDSIAKPNLSIASTLNSSGLLESPSIKLASTPFEKINPDSNEAHISSDWQIYVSGVSGIYDSSISDTKNLTTYTNYNLEESKTYTARVRYTGISGDSSDWSNSVTFQTINQFRNVIPQPNKNPVNESGGTLKYRDYSSVFGGFYAADMWQWAIQTRTTDNITITQTIDLVDKSVGGPASTNTQYKFDFAITDQYDKLYQQDIQPLFYIGQKVSVRLKSDTTKTLEGYIVKAYGSRISVGVFKTVNISARSILTGGFHVLVGYRLILGDRNIQQRQQYFDWYDSGRTYASITGNSYYNNSAGFNGATGLGALPMPFECFSTTEGYRITKALATMNQGKAWERAAWAAYTLNYNGKSDWYIPARDELVAIFYYCHNYTVSTVSSTAWNYKPWGYIQNSSSNSNYIKSTPVYTGPGGGSSRYSLVHNTFTGFGEKPDTPTDFWGLNRNSYVEQLEYNSPGWVLQPRLTDSRGYLSPVTDSGYGWSQRLLTSTLYSNDLFSDSNDRATYERNPFTPKITDNGIRLNTYSDLRLPYMNIGTTSTYPGLMETTSATGTSGGYRLIRRELI